MKMLSKICSGCHIEKAALCFSKSKNGKGGLHSCCKECNAKSSKASQEKNRARAIVVVPSSKTCRKCHVEKSTLGFSGSKTATDGLQSYCKECKSKTGKELCKKNSARETIIIPDFKTCYSCGLEKPASRFFEDKSRPDGLISLCRDCSSQAAKANREKNKGRETIIIPDFKTCSGCKTEKASVEFSKNGSSPDGLDGNCKKCTRIRSRKRLYGVTEEWYQAMLLAQGGACAICKWIPGPDDRELDVDHIHVDGWEEMPPEKRRLYVRGLLCGTCNRGIGYFKDGADSISKAIVYLGESPLEILYDRYLDKAIRNEILAVQSFLCKICSVDLRTTTADLDHCYKTGKVRGYLCHGCNCGLGQLKDSVKIMQSAIDYLNRHLVFVSSTQQSF